MILTEDTAERYVAEQSFDTGPAGFVGATVEMLPVALMPEPGFAVRGPVFQRLRHGHLSGSYDGVLAVSSPPSPGIDVAVRRTAEDVAMAKDLLARDGFAAGERALDAYRGGLPAADGVVFRESTAAVRVCLDAGTEGPELARRWAVAHAIGPVLTAAFANSPLSAGRPTGWRSTRQALRLRADRPLAPAGGDPRAAWTSYALDSPVAPGVSFRDRLRGRRRPDLEDLRQHLHTLPAPVRASGHLELTMIDAQPGDGWQVAVAVAATLVDDARAAAEALAATESLPADAWVRAARDGLTDPHLAEAARSCFLSVYASLARHGATRDLRTAVASYFERYVNRSRCPADDVLALTY